MFKVMTWNVENLFKPGTASGPSTREAYEAKLQGLAANINGRVPTRWRSRKSATRVPSTIWSGAFTGLTGGCRRTLINVTSALFG